MTLDKIQSHYENHLGTSGIVAPASQDKPDTRTQADYSVLESQTESVVEVQGTQYPGTIGRSLTIAICAWCGKDLGPRKGISEGITHGMCEPCKDKMLLPLRESRAAAQIPSSTDRPYAQL